ncbi:hypothetical protein THAOC_13705 [Thalassiosira oceanica]|uniref:Uncharacterized protein n=1 Tax=Thalassiosira oceanica TaxID=159749 RepID=K0SGW1_THAOC|nr:hypothetical protein THAOC_13705 [Thalassiosira oceanica]|eukprot:EJK65433.1 hypothetical protein THAOC_13705 [Thalassiosira oceanica]
MKTTIVLVCLLGAVAAAEAGLRGAAIAMDQAEADDPASENADSCALICKRIRLVVRKQDECVERCLLDNDASEGRSINHIDGGDDGEQDESDDPVIESEDTASACALRCKRLRLVGRKRGECVESCLLDTDASEGRSINHIDGGDDGEQDENDDTESEAV